MTRWLTVVGIGEDGLEGLGSAARALIDTAEVLAGGRRHLEKVPHAQAERLTWEGGMGAALDEIARRKPRRVTVLVSGDPMNFGIGAVFARRFGPDEMTVLPAPGAFSLAAARLGWSLADTVSVS